MSQKTVIRISAVISGISGLVILAGVIYPIVSYDTKFASKYDSLISPVSPETVDDVQGTAVTESVDYTQASNWFVGGATKEDFVSSKIEYYTIGIPKLKIDKAAVAIGG